MFIDEGGNFSPDFLARMLANKKGSASEDELAQSEAIPHQAISDSLGMMGTIKAVPGKLIPSELDMATGLYKKAADVAPKIMESSPVQNIRKLIPSEYVNPNIEQNLAKDADAAVRQEAQIDKWRQIVDQLKNR